VEKSDWDKKQIELWAAAEVAIEDGLKDDHVDLPTRLLAAVAFHLREISGALVPVGNEDTIAETLTRISEHLDDEGTVDTQLGRIRDAIKNLPQGG
jgi:hypothetical protein